MLSLKGITKIYVTPDENLTALDDVNLDFGKSEFVSILGPSGCGKTTLLNIIGGLDKYTSGSIEINGVSTEWFTDRDWDSYRNHSVGFIFQSYNLIPHLNVLDNVELALTLIGEKKEERKARALKALEEVGLRNKAFKKPNQLSGGQMQRVAIARALVNNPEIILADEPTGALDSETSVQVMDALKKISKTRLVIMVTHNAELARQYSTRIVKLFDGKVVGDTNPPILNGKQNDNGSSREKNNIGKAEEKSGDAENFALRYSGGVLSDNRAPVDGKELSGCNKCFVQRVAGEKIAVLTNSKGKIVTVLSTDIKRAFKGRLYEKKALSAAESADAENLLLSKKNKKEKKNEAAEKYRKKPSMSFGAAIAHSFKNLATKKFRTILTTIAGSIGILGIGLVLSLYSGLNGFIARQEASLASYPIQINEGSVQDTEAVISTIVSALDGLDGKYEKDTVYIYKVVRQLIKNQTNVNIFDAAMLSDIKSVDSSLYYDLYENYNINFNVVKDIPSSTKILGISTISDYYFAINTTSALGWAQLPSEELVNEQYELIAGKFPENANEIVLVLDAKNQISDLNLFFNGLDMESVSLNYKDASEETVTKKVTDFIGMEYRLVENDYYYNPTTRKKRETTKPKGPLENLNKLIYEAAGSGYSLTFFEGDGIDSNNDYDYSKMALNSEVLTISGVIKLKEDVPVGILGAKAIGYTKALTRKVIDNAAKSSLVNKYLESVGGVDNADKKVLRGYGYAELPASIDIYCRDFDSKSMVKTKLTELSNQRKADGKSQIVYSDMMSAVLGIVEQFINIITIVLLSLTAVSLVVSALMVGIITYVSVLERTREIGVLRALGARKTDVSGIFNVETILVGFASGVLGVILALVGSIPLGSLLTKYTGISGLVGLPWYFALALIALSVALNFLSGLIPASMAKRKDPVKALRSE